MGLASALLWCEVEDGQVDPYTYLVKYRPERGYSTEPCIHYMVLNHLFRRRRCLGNTSNQPRQTEWTELPYRLGT